MKLLRGGFSDVNQNGVFLCLLAALMVLFLMVDLISLNFLMRNGTVKFIDRVVECYRQVQGGKDVRF